MTPDSSASAAPPDHQLPSSVDTPRRKRRWWIWLVILILFGLLFYWIYSYRSAPAAAVGRHGFAGPVPIIPATATKGSLGVYLPAIGTVTPVYTDSINAEVTGVIQAVHYREGQYVRKGDPLIDIDPSPYAAQLMEAEGALQRDQALLAEAQMDLARYQLAWSKNAIPRQTLDDQAKLVLQDEGTVKNDEGVVQYDKVEVGFCHITSPINGRVGLRLVDPGNLITANSATTLVVVTQMQPITVIFTVAEGSLPQVLQQMRKGKQLQVQAWDSNNATELGVGRLISTSNLINTTTGTLQLRAEFANTNGMLFPNQFVNTKLLVTTLQNQTLVPSSAIQHNGAAAFVYVVKPGPGTQKGAPQAGTSRPAPAAAPPKSKTPMYHVVMTNVKTGVTDNNMTGVQGIQPGDVVADSGFEKLVDGSTVTLSNQKLNIHQTTIFGESEAP
ncbi:MAG TPA: efflux RND transporter periplasmic adaptor subunit [Acidobacteriaceae bacterium]|nr:efflux RND transporter periplasmic adaptor subunit [Acidobacteriaceae bacterium]